MFTNRVNTKHEFYCQIYRLLIIMKHLKLQGITNAFVFQYKIYKENFNGQTFCLQLMHYFNFCFLLTNIRFEIANQNMNALEYNICFNE